MPKPTQAEVAELVGRLRKPREENYLWGLHNAAADALEALMQERAEVHINYPILASTTQEAMGAAPPAKPSGELPPLPIMSRWPFDWPRKKCPCGDYQHGECMEIGCAWERNCELVPVALRQPLTIKPGTLFTADQMRAYALRALRERA